MKSPVMLFGSLVVITASWAWAHGPQDNVGSVLTGPLWLWGAGFAALAALVGFLFVQAKRGKLIGERFRGFSRNAKLLLVRSPFSGLSVSLLRLLFNLYLIAVGFDLLFVAKFAAINWTCHGLSVIPSGILSDLFGRRRIFLTAYTGNLLATSAIIFVTDPTWLLVLAAVTGLLEGGHAIVGPPFMVEQSRPDERIHLFSLNGGIQVGAASIGNLAAGVLPFVFAALFDIGPESAWARRAALFCAVPVMFCSMVPIYLIKEEWQPIDIKRWAKGIENWGRIGMLAFTEGMIGFALGFSAPFFNVFFAEHLNASTAQIGMIFALASIASAVITIFVPIAVHRLGRVRTVTLVKLLGIPGLILLAASHDLISAGVFYVLTILCIGGSYPNKSISDPIYTLFAMEVVKERERGTTNGIMHAFVEFPMGVGASFAGPLMAVGDWQTAYVISGAIFATAFIIYYFYFARIEVREQFLQPAPARS
ncbi:MAG TPA: MFS transporter [Candidatus Binatia bacterium]|nr:MFS transporter [Candidatus Binatia bacterium]